MYYKTNNQIKENTHTMKKELNTEKLRFEDLHLSREMQKAITDMGFERHTHSIAIHSTYFRREGCNWTSANGHRKNSSLWYPCIRDD